MMSEREEAARAFFNAAGGSYPPFGQPTPAAAVEPPSPAAVVPPVAVIADAPPATPAEQADERLAALQGLYAPVPTRGLVEWDEPAAAVGQFDLQAPIDLLDQTPDGKAALNRLRDGFAAAGAGVTIARELFGDAILAQQDPRWTVSQETAETQLRQHFGGRYEAQVEGARALVQRAAARCPEIIPFLERTGLGNSPEFIRKLAAAASKRGAR